MFTKIQVGFQHPAQGMNDCDECIHYLGGRCEIVEGIVQAEDWCRKFKLDPSAKEQEAMENKPTGRSTMSPSDINKRESDASERDRKEADARSSHPGEGIKEHGLHVTSRTTGKSVEITFGPQGGGLVPKNPFASLAQEGYLHAHPEKLGAEKLAEFDSATKGMKLPKRAKKK